MVKSTIDDIKDITLERQIRKLADVIDEQNNKIDAFADYSTDINNLKESDANQTIQINNLKQTVATDKLATDSAITAIQNKDTEQDGTLTEHTTLIQDITKSLVSGVQIMSGTTTGEIKVRLERESAAAIDSNNYNLGLPVSAEVIQGTGPSMFKIQITMSSGVKVVSNDFVFTTEAIGTDVYISSFTFKAGNQAGYLSADIGLNNGVVIEANNFLVPTDPNVTSAITDLQNRVSTIESTGVAGLNELKTTVDGHTTAINELNTDVANLTTDKADVNNGNQSITAGTVNATNINKNGVGVATINDIPDISGKVNIAQGVENSGKVLGIGSDGNVTPVDVGGGSGGEVWEEIALIDNPSFPTNWTVNDKIKIEIIKFPKPAVNWSSSTGWTNSFSVSFDTNTDTIDQPLVLFPKLYSGSAGVKEENSINCNSKYLPMDYIEFKIEVSEARVDYLNQQATANRKYPYIYLKFFNGASHYIYSLEQIAGTSNYKNYFKFYRLKQ